MNPFNWNVDKMFRAVFHFNYGILICGIVCLKKINIWKSQKHGCERCYFCLAVCIMSKTSMCSTSVLCHEPAFFCPSFCKARTSLAASWGAQIWNTKRHVIWTTKNIKSADGNICVFFTLPDQLTFLLGVLLKNILSCEEMTNHSVHIYAFYPLSLL